MLVATAASAEDQRLPASDGFRVSWQREKDPVAARILGRVQNLSLFRLTDVRLDVQGLDADRRPVGRMFVWAIGDLMPGGETSFVFDAMTGAVSYTIAVVSYDVVSEPTEQTR